MEKLPSNVHECPACTCGEDYECFVEFTLPMGGKILINIYQILAIIEDFDMKRTEIRVFQNAYMVEGTYADIKEKIEEFVCKD